MESNHGEEQVSLLNEYDHARTSSSPSPLPTHMTEKTRETSPARNIETQTIWDNPISTISSSKKLRLSLTALLPSFLQKSYDYKTKIHPTSWLDGLRGVAAFIVYIHHGLLIWFPSLSYGYASAPEFTWFFQLPFLRIIYSGRGMVSIFFVISGYALSYSALRKIHAGNYTAVLDTLASSTFRRWLRLFLPVMASTFISLILIRLNLYTGHGGAFFRSETLWGQIRNWWGEFVRISDPFMPMVGDDTYNNHYSPQLWTIPREMKGSMATYIILLCIAKTKHVVRIVCLAFFCWYTLWVQQWDLYLFFGGILLAEFDLLRAAAFKDADSTALFQFLPVSISRHARIIMHTLTAVLTILSLHILTFPDLGAEHTYGYNIMIIRTPSTYGNFTLMQRYWLAIGATLLVFAMSLSPFRSTVNTKMATPLLQAPFNSRIAQYLGKISFGLYITHLSTIYTINSRIIMWTAGRSPNMYFAAFAFSCVVTSMATLWAADLFWRAFDTRSVSFAKRVGTWCFVEQGDGRLVYSH